MKYKVKFSYKPLIGGKHSVFLAGDFNNWHPNNTPMKEKAGIYETELELHKGQYAYKFVVDGRWICDEKAHNFFGDGFGEQNSVIIVGDDLNQLYQVKFSYKPKTKKAKKVALVGSFNRWSNTRDLMQKNENGNFEITIYLRAGEYHFKYLIDDKTYDYDKNAEKLVDDGFGSKQSVIYVDEDFVAYNLIKGDGNILLYGLDLDQNLNQVHPLSENEIELRTKSYKNDVEFIWLITEFEEKLPMQKYASDKLFDYFRISYTLNEKHKLKYCFLYQDGPTKVYKLNKINSKYKLIDKFYEFSKNNANYFYTPDWVKDGIFYQIFVDRFCNGNPKINPDFTEDYYNPEVNVLSPAVKDEKYKFIADWNDIKPLSNKTNPGHFVFYGGDIAGIKQKIDYLHDLGITIIYFNPLNKAESNHKYDAIDYFEIDPHFGTNDEFKELVALLHEKGIRVIVDFAFNHTGCCFDGFLDCIKMGSASKYYNWFEWKKWPLPNPLPSNFNPLDYYQCWWGFATLPDLDWDKNLPHPIENTIQNVEDATPNWDVVNYVLDVAEFWLKDLDIDGFRLDVPNEVPFWFWKLFRKKVKSIKPNAYLVGEIWTDAEEWVNHHYFDAVMNYIYFKDPVTRFFAKQNENAKQFTDELLKGLVKYPPQASQVMMNLLSSHDTFRYNEVLGNNLKAFKLSIIFKLTFIGAPHIFYGDEIAMMGAHDPDNRRPFDWDYTKNANLVEFRKFYKHLIKIRKENACLRRGDFNVAYAEGKVLAYYRRYKNELILVAINNSNEEAKFSLSAENGNYTDLITGTKTNIESDFEVSLKPMQGCIFKKQ